MQAALAALATLGVTVTLDGDCGRTELAATSPAPYNSATKCTKLKNIDNLESICDSSYYASGDDLIACSYNTQIERSHCAYRGVRRGRGEGRSRLVCRTQKPNAEAAILAGSASRLNRGTRPASR